MIFSVAAVPCNAVLGATGRIGELLIRDMQRYTHVVGILFGKGYDKAVAHASACPVLLSVIETAAIYVAHIQTRSHTEVRVSRQRPGEIPVVQIFFARFINHVDKRRTEYCCSFAFLCFFHIASL